ncbi:hypothetical protein EJ377_17950 [Chryseobacterium arthrosphaerae]|uniref:Uncharacterized protein n=1 Tax=Chryseobacterium arthrosphaerae TaxID=651561 RepID=A0A432DT03_9FLAO|nr:hypothetical protein EJ377_17950 [Chryseobacterium arthrosphaerae]
MALVFQLKAMQLKCVLLRHYLPIKQQEINNDTYSSYYLRDSAGKVFVLGNNNWGQLGIGVLTTFFWLPITIVNEQPDVAGVQTDVAKPIKKVTWISANNHDSYMASFYLITEDRAYSAGSNEGDKSGVPLATSRFIPTAVTTANGTQILSGKMLFVETTGHISILVKDRNDRYGYVGHTIHGSDGCGPKEFNFNGLLQDLYVVILLLKRESGQP